MKGLLYLSIISMINGFLLKSKNTSLQGKQSYVTISEYYGDKVLSQQELHAYQQQQAKTLDLLSMQIQQKYDVIEKRIIDTEQLVNSSRQHSTAASQERYKKLEGKYEELEVKYNKSQKLLAKMQQDFNELKNQMTSLKQLTSINQSQTLQDMKRTIQNIDIQVNSLENTEQARTQDFMAFYTKINFLEEKNEHIKDNLTASELKHYISMEAFAQNQNMAMKLLENQTRIELERITADCNLSLSSLQQYIENQLQPVVLSACYRDNGAPLDEGSIQFPLNKTAIGIPDLPSFITTGKFKASKQGLYFVTVTVEVYETTSFEIMKNRKSQNILYLTAQVANWVPGTTVIVLDLQENDIVWVHLTSRKRINNACLTIFKIK